MSLSKEIILHLPIGFAIKPVSEREIREAQTALLSHSLNGEQRALIDACLSWFGQHRGRL